MQKAKMDVRRTLLIKKSLSEFSPTSILLF